VLDWDACDIVSNTVGAGTLPFSRQLDSKLVQTYVEKVSQETHVLCSAPDVDMIVSHYRAGMAMWLAYE